MRLCIGAVLLVALQACDGGGFAFVGQTGSAFIRIGDIDADGIVELPSGAVRQGTVSRDLQGRITAGPETSRVSGTLRLRQDGQGSFAAARVATGGRSIALDRRDTSTTRTRLPADARFDHFVRDDASGTAVIDVARPAVFGFEHMVFGYWQEDPTGSQGSVGAGAFGSASDVSRVPSNGTARYFGGSTGLVVEADGVSQRLSSDVVLAADFTAQRLDFASSGPFDPNSGQARADFSVTGALRISGNGFSGTGTTANGWSGPIDGRFFGPAAREAGGAFDLSGEGRERYVAGFGARR